jgi:hypothetical protein
VTAPVVESRRPPLARLLGFALLLAAVSWGLGTFSAWPWAASEPGAATIRVAFKHVATFEQAGAALSKEELERLPRHMRPQDSGRAGTGRRVETALRLAVDGRTVLDRRYTPGGLRRDGPTFGDETVAVAPGARAVTVELTDGVAAGAAGAGRSWRLEETIDVRPGQAVLIEFTEEAGLRVHSASR